MTITAPNTMRWRVARAALVGAVLLNVVTLVWAFHTTTRTLVIVAIVLAVVGGAIGAAVGWATAPNRWGRWWAERRTRRRGFSGSRPGDPV